MYVYYSIGNDQFICAYSHCMYGYNSHNYGPIRTGSIGKVVYGLINYFLLAVGPLMSNRACSAHLLTCGIQ